MSQKSYVVLTASVTFPIPAGKTQADALKLLLEAAKVQFAPGTVLVSHSSARPTTSPHSNAPGAALNAPKNPN